jgi:hypothetical protein
VKRRRLSYLDRQADRRVDDAHQAATRQPDPVAYMREQQAAAEARWTRWGDKASLALVRAFARSLDGAES